MDPGIGTAIAEGGKQLTQNTFNAHMQMYQNQRNKKLMREQMAWQTREREAQNAWSEQMWQRANWYDAPINQTRRLLEAGLNPQAALSEGITGTTGNSASVPAANSSGVSAQAFPFVAPQLQFDSILDVVQKLANIKKTGVETKRLDSLLDFEIKNAELELSMKRITEEVYKEFHPKEAEKMLEKIASEINKNNSEVSLNDAKLDNYNADTMVKQTIEALNYLDIDAKKINNTILPSLLRATYDKLLADAYASRESGKKFSEESESLRIFRPLQRLAYERGNTELRAKIRSINSEADIKKLELYLKANGIDGKGASGLLDQIRYLVTKGPTGNGLTGKQLEDYLLEHGVFYEFDDGYNDDGTKRK